MKDDTFFDVVVLRPLIKLILACYALGFLMLAAWLLAIWLAT
jgi:hypothetical protein